MPRSTQGHHLNNFGSSSVPDAAYQASSSSVNYFWRRKILKVFTIYGLGGHIGNVIRRLNIFLFPPSLEISMYSLRQLYIPIFRPKSSQLFMKSYVLAFSHIWPWSRKIDSLRSQFAFYQSIDQPTHYTENSASLLDIILVHNKDSLVFSGVGDPFLGQDLRYHCPVFGILKFSKPKMK